MHGKVRKVVDFFVVKGVLEGLFGVLGVSNQITYAPAKREGMHPGRTADIVLDGEVMVSSVNCTQKQKNN